MPIWVPSLDRGRASPGRRLLAAPLAPRAEPGRRLPAPPRAARRHHPDPVPAHPERRLDRRRVPDRRASPSSCSRPSSAPRRRRRRRGGRSERRPAASAAGSATTARCRGASPASAGSGPAGTGLSPACRRTCGAAALERPLVLGPGAGLAGRHSPSSAASRTSRHGRRGARRRARAGPARHVVDDGIPVRPASRSAPASGATRMSASRSTARSRRCGWAS